MLQVLLCTYHMCCSAASLTWCCQPHLAGCFSANFPCDGTGRLAHARPAKQLYLQSLQGNERVRLSGIQNSMQLQTKTAAAGSLVIAGNAARSDE